MNEDDYPCLIDDGVPEEFTVPAREGVRKVTGLYRPALNLAIERHLKVIAGGDPDKIAAANVKLFADHVVDWNYHDRNGNKAAINEENVARVHHSVIAAALNHIQTYGPKKQAEQLGN